jgi:hypothetical protein
MNYTKPEVTSFASANSAIQSQTKDVSTKPDSELEPNLTTVTAYESDE